MGGGKLVHMYKWDAGEALKLIERERITAVSGVPVMAREHFPSKLCVNRYFKFDDPRRRRRAVATGLGWQNRPASSNGSANTGYGMTETCGIITSISGDHFVDKPASCGPAMPAFESKIVNPETHEEVPAGEPGELWVRGAHVIRGYLNREEATTETIIDGWLRTGDMARKDEDDFIYIVDRIKDMVLRGGENIYCAEVESAIFDHADVAECTVFGVPDDRLGEEVGIAVYLKPGATASADALRDHCTTQLAKFKVPRYVGLLKKHCPATRQASLKRNYATPWTSRTPLAPAHD